MRTRKALSVGCQVKLWVGRAPSQRGHGTDRSRRRAVQHKIGKIVKSEIRVVELGVRRRFYRVAVDGVELTRWREHGELEPVIG